MDQFDFMSLLGVSDNGSKEAKKEMKNKAKAAENPVPKSDMAEMPCMVVIGPEQPVHLTKEVFGGEEKVELDRLIKHVKDNYLIPSVPYKANKLGKSRIFIYPDASKSVPVSKMKMREDDMLYVGRESYSLSDIVDIAGAEDDKEVVRKFLEQEYPPFAFGFIKAEDGYMAVPEGRPVKEVSFPLIIHNLMGEDIVWQAKDFGTDMEGKKDTADDGLKKARVTAEDVERKLAEEVFKGCQGALKLLESRTMQEGECHVAVTVAAPSGFHGAGQVSANKEKTYPSDCVISLITRRIQLSPEMFGGKQELSENDIIRFLGRDYPEYTKSRTLFSYDEETKFLVPLIKGSSKGVVFYPSEELALEAASCQGYFLGTYKKCGQQFRMEKTFISLTCAGEYSHGGKFEYYLPKIPSSIIRNTCEMFRRVMRRYDTEALVWICYDRQAGRYEIVVPEQKVSHVSVVSDAILAESNDYFKVADFHSHGCINFPFSPVDNANEKGNHIFGVAINLAGEGEVLWRAGTGGRYVPISEECFVTAQEPDYAVPSSVSLFELWCRVSEIH